MIESASKLAKSVSIENLFQIVTGHEAENIRAKEGIAASAVLAKICSEQGCSVKDSLRGFVKTGLRLLASLPEIVVRHLDDPNALSPQILLWLRAIEIAAQKTDRGEFALLLTEHWLERNAVVSL